MWSILTDLRTFWYNKHMKEREIDSLLAPNASFLVAAHELKSPLSIIRQLSLMIDDPDVGLSPAEITTITGKISQTSDRALRLVNDLTKVARLEDAMLTLEPINACKVCDDIVDEMADIFASYGKRIATRPYRGNNDNTKLAVANYNLLRSILLNFSDNALYAGAEESEVVLAVQNRQGKLRISVRDYGDELPLAVWRAIKKQSNQPVNSGSRPESSGLGIYIAQNFARAMGGKVGVTKHRDGNTFYVDLVKSEQLSLL